ncbi:MAG: serine hydrolase [Candidatus Odinarchaeota archaeon]
MKKKMKALLLLLFIFLITNLPIASVNSMHSNNMVNTDYSYLNNMEKAFKDSFTSSTQVGSSLASTSPYSNNFANLTGHGWRVREVAFSPVESILASGSSDGTIRLWNLTDGKVLHSLNKHHYGVIALDFSPSGELLASGGIDNKINLWNVSSGEHLRTWSLFPHGVIDIKWSPDGKTLAVGGGEWMVDVKHGNQPDKLLQLLDAATGDVLHSFIGHTDAVSSIAFSKNGSHLISGSWDRSVRLWDVSSGTELHSFTNHTDRVTSVTFSKDDTAIISGSLDGKIKLWDVITGNISRELSANQSIWSIALSPADSTLAVAVDPLLTWPDRYWLTFGQMHDCPIQLWNITTGKIIDTLTGHVNTIESLKFSFDGTILATASWDWTVKLWGDHLSLTIDLPVDEWPTSSPDDQGINSTILNGALSRLENTAYHNLHSLLVIRYGKLVHEQYFSDEESQVYTSELKHTHFSATKSFSSALIGIAIDKGFIKDTEQRVLDFFPEKTFDNVDSRKEAMTLYHLLTMTTGMEWEDASDIWEMAVADSSVEYVLSKPMVADPGSEYHYNTGASQLLSAIIQETTGYSARDFAMKYLFGPLGIEELDVIWGAGSDRVNYGGIGLFMTPRNMAKFGQLYLNNGKWEGKQIISSSWIRESSRDHIEGIPRTGFVYPQGYGYQFWVGNSSLTGNYYFALGYGGQTIQIFPEHDLVVVTTARQDEFNARSVSYDIIESIDPDFKPKNASWSILSVAIALPLVVLIGRKKKLNR